MNAIPRMSISIIIGLRIFFLLIVYSGFLFPNVFAFHHIQMISIPVNEPPIEPVMSRILKKAFFMLEFMMIRAIVNGMKQTNIEGV